MSTLRVQLNKLSSDWQVARALLEDEYTSLHKTLNKFQNRYEFAQHLLDVHRNWCVRRTIAWSSRCLPQRSDGQNDRDAAEFGSRIYVSASTQTGDHDDDESSQEKNEDEDHREEESVDGWIDLQDDISDTHQYSTDLQSNFESSNPVSDLHTIQEVVSDQLYDVHLESSRKESTSEQRHEDEIPTPHSASDVQFGVESTNHVSDLLIKEEVVSYENDDVHIESSLNESTNQLTHEERIPTLRIRSDVESHLERIDSFSDIFIKQEPEENYDVDVEMDMNASTSHQGPAEWIPTQHIASDGNSVDIYNEPSTSTLHRDIDSPELSSQDIVDTDGNTILGNITKTSRTAHHMNKHNPEGTSPDLSATGISNNKNKQSQSRSEKRKSIQCKVCSKTYFSLSGLYLHLKTHAKTRLQNQKTSLTCHMRTHTGEKPYHCTVCNMAFKTHSNFSRHLRTHTGEKPYHCAVCNKTFTRRSCLSRHMRIHIGDKPFQCSLCNYKCSQSGSLVFHMRSHTREKPFQCTICNKAFTKSGDLSRHVRTHTGEKPFECNLCSFRCSQKSSLSVHMRTHKGEKPFQCSLCNYRCFKKSSLVFHLKSHTSEKPFQCSKCEMVFTKSDDLSRHIKTHTTEKSFECNFCSFQCSQKGSLTCHMRTHTGGNSYDSSVCNNACTRPCNLLSHVRPHILEKPFQCSLCSFRCSEQGSLTRHFKCHKKKTLSLLCGHSF